MPPPLTFCLLFDRRECAIHRLSLHRASNFLKLEAIGSAKFTRDTKAGETVGDIFGKILEEDEESQHPDEAVIVLESLQSSEGRELQLLKSEECFATYYSYTGSKQVANVALREIGCSSIQPGCLELHTVRDVSAGEEMYVYDTDLAGSDESEEDEMEVEESCDGDVEFEKIDAEEADGEESHEMDIESFCENSEEEEEVPDSVKSSSMVPRSDGVISPLTLPSRSSQFDVSFLTGHNAGILVRKEEEGKPGDDDRFGVGAVSFASAPAESDAAREESDSSTLDTQILENDATGVETQFVDSGDSDSLSVPAESDPALAVLDSSTVDTQILGESLSAAAESGSALAVSDGSTVEASVVGSVSSSTSLAGSDDQYETSQSEEVVTGTASAAASSAPATTGAASSTPALTASANATGTASAAAASAPAATGGASSAPTLTASANATGAASAAALTALAASASPFPALTAPAPASTARANTTGAASPAPAVVGAGSVVKAGLRVVTERLNISTEQDDLETSKLMGKALKSTTSGEGAGAGSDDHYETPQSEEVVGPVLVVRQLFARVNTDTTGRAGTCQLVACIEYVKRHFDDWKKEWPDLATKNATKWLRRCLIDLVIGMDEALLAAAAVAEGYQTKDEYIEDLSLENTWCDDIMLSKVCEVFGVNVFVWKPKKYETHRLMLCNGQGHSSVTSRTVYSVVANPSAGIHVFYNDKNHYEELQLPVPDDTCVCCSGLAMLALDTPGFWVCSASCEQEVKSALQRLVSECTKDTSVKRKKKGALPLFCGVSGCVRVSSRSKVDMRRHLLDDHLMTVHASIESVSGKLPEPNYPNYDVMISDDEDEIGSEDVNLYRVTDAVCEGFPAWLSFMWGPKQALKNAHLFKFIISFSNVKSLKKPFYVDGVDNVEDFLPKQFKCNGSHTRFFGNIDDGSFDQANFLVIWGALLSFVHQHDLTNEEISQSVLVHCNAGLQRSAAFIIFLLMHLNDRMDYDSFLLLREALGSVRGSEVADHDWVNSALRKLGVDVPSSRSGRLKKTSATSPARSHAAVSPVRVTSVSSTASAPSVAPTVMNVCHGIEITTVEVHRLRNKRWLNDAIVNGYMKWLVARYSYGRKCIVIGSEFFARNSEENLDRLRKTMFSGSRNRRINRKTGFKGVKFIFLPACNDEHWIFFVVAVESRLVYAYDSLMSAMTNQYMADLLQFLNANLDGDWASGHPKSNPQQVDGFSCGVFGCRSSHEIMVRADTFNPATDELMFPKRESRSLANYRLKIEWAITDVYLGVGDGVDVSRLDVKGLELYTAYISRMSPPLSSSSPVKLAPAPSRHLFCPAELPDVTNTEQLTFFNARVYFGGVEALDYVKSNKFELHRIRTVIAVGVPEDWSFISTRDDGEKTRFYKV